MSLTLALIALIADSGAQYLRSAEHIELRQLGLFHGPRTLSQTRSQQQRQLHACHGSVHRCGHE